jgi:hypothetical protein
MDETFTTSLTSGTPGPLLREIAGLNPTVNDFQAMRRRLQTPGPVRQVMPEATSVSPGQDSELPFAESRPGTPSPTLHSSSALPTSMAFGTAHNLAHVTLEPTPQVAADALSMMRSFGSYTQIWKPPGAYIGRSSTDLRMYVNQWVNYVHTALNHGMTFTDSWWIELLISNSQGQLSSQLQMLHLNNPDWYFFKFVASISKVVGYESDG